MQGREMVMSLINLLKKFKMTKNLKRLMTISTEIKVKGKIYY